MPLVGPPLAVGIVGTSPCDARGVRRFARFADVQRVLGELEAVRPGTFPAGHAACHALMNGVPRVVFHGVGDVAREAPGAVQTLVRGGEVALIVVPGLQATEVTGAVVSAFEAERRLAGASAAGSDVTLWLDTPAGVPLRELAQQRRDAAQASWAVRYVVPPVRTISPGCRAFESLPATCLVAPLALGCTAALRGVHEIDAPCDAELRRELVAAGCGVLEARGLRRLVHLAAALPVLPSTEPPPVEGAEGLSARIEAALEDACRGMGDGPAPGPALWKSLERQAQAVLARFQQAGDIEAFVARCDADTNEGALAGPVVEVLVRLPRRVRSVVVRLAPLAGPRPR